MAEKRPASNRPSTPVRHVPAMRRKATRVQRPTQKHDASRLAIAAVLLAFLALTIAAYGIAAWSAWRLWQLL